MDMTDFRPELHVAQQSRRDKLRVQQMNDFSNTWDHALVVHHHHHQSQSGINPDLVHVRSVRNAGSSHDQALVPSGLIGFSQNPIAIPVQTDVILAYQDCATMFMNTPQAALPSSTALAAIKDGSDPQGCSNWKTVDSSQLSCDNWTVMNYGSDQVGRASNVGEVLSNNFNVRNDILDRSLHCSKPNYDAGQDIARSSMTSSEISSQDDNQKCQLNPIYQNSLQNLVTVACSGTRNNGRESTYEHGSWSGNFRGEHVFLPSYGNQQPDSWLSRPVGNNVNPWTHESGCNVTRKCDEEPRNFTAASAKQGLSLSLSPEIPNPSIISKSSGKLLHDIVGGGAAPATSSVNVQRHVGPLGPFTGYATILKSSRFLKPAQELLDDFCNACVSRMASRSEASMDVANATTEEEGGGRGNDDSGMLSSTVQSCNEVGGCSTSEPFKPENREKKAKLLFLLEEVCRRYKLYNQQMQMVVSSFESVAGLSTATPYISLALKRISRSFQSLRTAISDQLKHIARLLGDDYGGNNTSNIKYMDRGNNNNNNNNDSFQKQRSLMGNNAGFLEPQPQHHIWRPQRGLPERAVTILRAWLFDHFLHPYPTDTDKQMLATQTGLSRNQVSNWFINARVRVWKPMVEEIHMLETRAMAAEAKHQNLTRSNPANNIEPSDRLCNNLGLQEPSRQTMEFPAGTSSANNSTVLEKRARVEYTRGSNMDVSGLVGFMPYNERSGFERGLGNVSLTLGLRHGVDNVTQTQTQMQTRTQDHHLFGGGHMYGS